MQPDADATGETDEVRQSILPLKVTPESNGLAGWPYLRTVGSGSSATKLSGLMLGPDLRRTPDRISHSVCNSKL